MSGPRNSSRYQVVFAAPHLSVFAPTLREARWLAKEAKDDSVPSTIFDYSRGVALESHAPVSEEAKADRYRRMAETRKARNLARKAAEAK